MTYTAGELKILCDLEDDGSVMVDASAVRDAIEACARIADIVAGAIPGSCTEVSKAGAAIRRRFGLLTP